MSRFPSLLAALLLLSFGCAQSWQPSSDGRFVVETASEADREQLAAVFAVLREAARDLRQEWGFTLPETVTIRVHPTLESFQEATSQPWFVAAAADRRTATLHLQRLRVLSERRSLEATLRHELFHLAQPEDWPRWRAEGEAMRFAGETPRAEALELSDAELDAILAAPSSSEDLARAVATAWRWVQGQGPN